MDDRRVGSSADRGVMANIMAGYGLYEALKDEGYVLPDECGDVEMRLPVDGIVQLAYIVNLNG